MLSLKMLKRLSFSRFYRLGGKTNRWLALQPTTQYLQYNRYQPTIFTILPGTTMTFFGTRPSNCAMVFSCAITVFSISSLLKSKGNSNVKRKKMKHTGTFI